MAVPEAPFDLHNDHKSLHHNVGTARQARSVEPETETYPMKGLPDGDLRSCVLRADGRHDLGTLLGGEHIGHADTIPPRLGRGQARKTFRK